VRLDLIHEALLPRIGHKEIEREIRKIMRNDPIKAEQAVGSMYGYSFRKAEEAYAKRGSRGRQDWSGIPVRPIQ
jgi:hypothetical protein